LAEARVLVLAGLIKDTIKDLIKGLLARVSIRDLTIAHAV